MFDRFRSAIVGFSAVLLVWGLLCVVATISNIGSSRRAILDAGYRDPRVSGLALDYCNALEFYRLRFTATASDGARVDVVACGFWGIDRFLEVGLIYERVYRSSK